MAVYIPDIKIEQVSEKTVMVYSNAMQYESAVAWNDLINTIIELCTEYSDLVEAGEVTKPKF